jgi:hypothetical protein
MKTCLLAFLVGLSITRVFCQGTIDFENSNVNVPVYQADKVTRLSGPQFLAELFVGLEATNLAAIATTSFLTGNGAGYFRGGTAGTVTLTGVSPGEVAWVQVDVWNTASGSSFAQAEASGLPNSWWQSSVFTLVAGGGGINPFPPAVLTGLGNSPVFLNSVPEPSTFALCVVGALLVLLRSRRKNIGVTSQQLTCGLSLRVSEKEKSNCQLLRCDPSTFDDPNAFHSKAYGLGASVSKGHGDDGSELSTARATDLPCQRSVGLLAIIGSTGKTAVCRRWGWSPCSAR